MSRDLGRAEQVQWRAQADIVADPERFRERTAADYAALDAQGDALTLLHGRS